MLGIKYAKTTSVPCRKLTDAQGTRKHQQPCLEVRPGEVDIGKAVEFGGRLAQIDGSACMKGKWYMKMSEKIYVHDCGVCMSIWNTRKEEINSER